MLHLKNILLGIAGLIVSMLIILLALGFILRTDKAKDFLTNSFKGNELSSVALRNGLEIKAPSGWAIYTTQRKGEYLSFISIGRERFHTVGVTELDGIDLESEGANQKVFERYVELYQKGIDDLPIGKSLHEKTLKTLRIEKTHRFQFNGTPWNELTLRSGKRGKWTLQLVYGRHLGKGILLVYGYRSELEDREVDRKLINQFIAKLGESREQAQEVH